MYSTPQNPLLAIIPEPDHKMGLAPTMRTETRWMDRSTIATFAWTQLTTPWSACAVTCFAGRVSISGF